MQKEKPNTPRGWGCLDSRHVPPVGVGLRGGARQVVTVVGGQLLRAAAEGNGKVRVIETKGGMYQQLDS